MAIDCLIVVDVYDSGGVFFLFRGFSYSYYNRVVSGFHYAVNVRRVNDFL